MRHYPDEEDTEHFDLFPSYHGLATHIVQLSANAVQRYVDAASQPPPGRRARAGPYDFYLRVPRNPGPTNHAAATAGAEDAAAGAEEMTTDGSSMADNSASDELSLEGNSGGDGASGGEHDNSSGMSDEDDNNDTIDDDAWTMGADEVSL